MVQILPPVPSFSQELGQKLGAAVGEGLRLGTQMYQQHQKQKRFNEALQNIEGVYSNPELNEQQRLIQAYRELSRAGEPELARHLGGQLAGLGRQQEGFLNKILGRQQEQEQMAQAFQNIQDIQSDPNLSDEQKILSVYQELSQNPTLAHNLLGSLEQPAKARGQDIAGRQFSRGYDALLEGDNDTFREVLDDPATPLSIKRKLTDLQEKQETRKGTKAGELRRRQSFVQNAYRQAIDNEKKKLKFSAEEDHKGIINNIKRLQTLQKSDLKKLIKNPEDYQDLDLWNMFPEQESGQFEESQFEQPEMGAQEKVRFDSKNPEHVARARQVLAEVGGDRAKANEILAQEFIK